LRLLGFFDFDFEVPPATPAPVLGESVMQDEERLFGAVWADLVSLLFINLRIFLLVHGVSSCKQIDLLCANNLQ
jgi:hypothetical protein